MKYTGCFVLEVFTGLTMITTVYFCLSYTVPSVAPKNLIFHLTEQQLSLTWAALEEEELNGQLLAYKVQWNMGGESQVCLLSISKGNAFKCTGCKLCKTWNEEMCIS